MAKYVCSIVNCPIISDRAKCPKHRAEDRRQRGTTTAMGLGWDHQQRRAELIRAALNSRCPDCGAWMNDPTQMVADHSTPRSIDRTSKADRVHCRPCSDAQGGRLGRQRHSE